MGNGCVLHTSGVHLAPGGKVKDQHPPDGPAQTLRYDDETMSSAARPFGSTRPTRTSRIITTLTVVLIVLFGVLTAPGVASAHTDFDGSSPSDQETVAGPLAEITVRFTNPARESGEGFRLLDPAGTVVAPTAVDATDGTRFVLQFDPPLTDGTYGFRWEVQAGDAHPIDGSFRFTVTGAASPAIDTSVPDQAAVAATGTGVVDAVDEVVPAVELESFLGADGVGDDATPVGRAGRALTFLGTIFGLGALAALTWVIRGRRDELRSVLSWVRLAGLVIGVGGVVELAALQSSSSVAVTELLETKAGVAALLKIVGGLVVWFGIHDRAGQLIAPQRSLSAAVALDLASHDVAGSVPTHVESSGTMHRWAPTRSAAFGMAGYAVVLVSLWFDGHTVSRGPWAIHSLVNLVHVGAAAVWGGGVFAMATVVWMRRRRSEEAGLAEMVIRFSGIAAASLVAVIVAGLTMTFMIVDGPGDLFSTAWGRLLIAKTLVVAIGAGIGGYNHFRLKPALESSPNDPSLALHLRRSLTIESAVFGAIVVITAFLVAAAT